MIWLADMKSQFNLVDSPKNVTIIKRLNNRQKKVCPKIIWPNEVIGWADNSVWRMIRLKKVRLKIIRPMDVIGWADNSIRRMIRPKKFRPKIIRPMDVIGWADDSVRRMIRPKKVCPKISDQCTWLAEPMVLSEGSSEGWSEVFCLAEPMLLSCMTRRPPCRPARRIWLDEQRALSLLGERDWLVCPIYLSW